MVRRALARGGYIGGGAGLVVAVSGGPDSMALLHCLLRLRGELGLTLHVAHLNHDFRGEEAEEDARFVERVAHELGLLFTIGAADPRTHQRKYGVSSFEEAAREVRYDFLSLVARQQEAKAIALGHTADDQVETLLMHMLRGSGIPGLRGMQEVTPWQSPRGGAQGTLFRPLLEATRRDTLSYCGQCDIAFRQDTTNAWPQFTRNRLRHQLLPVLETYNPGVRKSILRLGRSASLAQDYLDQQVEEIWPAVGVKVSGSVVLDAGKLKSLHPLMRRLIMRRAYREVKGDLRRLREVHLARMVEMASGPSGALANLPQGLKLYSQGQSLVLGASAGEEGPYPPFDDEYPLDVPGTTSIPGWVITAEVVPTPSSPKTSDPLVAFFDQDRMGAEFRARTRRDGDRFHPLGMAQEKKLQDFYVDQKVPRHWRDRVPLLVSQRGILWVVGHRPSELARLTRDTRRVVRAQWRRADLEPGSS